VSQNQLGVQVQFANTATGQQVEQGSLGKRGHSGQAVYVQNTSSGQLGAKRADHISVSVLIVDATHHLILEDLLVWSATVDATHTSLHGVLDVWVVLWWDDGNIGGHYAWVNWTTHSVELARESVLLVHQATKWRNSIGVAISDVRTVAGQVAQIVRNHSTVDSIAVQATSGHAESIGWVHQVPLELLGDLSDGQTGQSQYDQEFHA